VGRPSGGGDACRGGRTSNEFDPTVAKRQRAVRWRLSSDWPAEAKRTLDATIVRQCQRSRGVPAPPWFGWAWLGARTDRDRGGSGRGRFRTRGSVRPPEKNVLFQLETSGALGHPSGRHATSAGGDEAPGEYRIPEGRRDSRSSRKVFVKRALTIRGIKPPCHLRVG